jgi:hypothetical protein
MHAMGRARYSSHIQHQQQPTNYHLPHRAGIFLLCKQIRESPDLAHPQTYYYVMHGTVYQCPTIQHVLTARMVRYNIYVIIYAAAL